MPRVLIDVNEAWLERYQNGVSQAVDTLYGLSHQIANTPTADFDSAVKLLDEIESQLTDLRRNIEAWRIIF